MLDLFNAVMLRSGAYIVSDFPRDRLCRIACARANPSVGIARGNIVKPPHLNG